ncbi:rubredoxin [Mitsuokella sp. oral taxon 131]|uniref:rubredoxin n=1 Tax=Mitsuokella sp. oral taxon 131 TaxID=1321780 RepID=UPI0003ADD970|nr:rubredoxin [Mitsuokella sp. oral taxon 131]ERL05054.1 rubredoxin [Mitsuokella sp. oral taxon 131 str. W9106]
MKVWVCTVCGWIYDEAKGDAEYGLKAGVAFADLPDDFVCPLCGVGKDMFEEQS